MQHIKILSSDSLEGRKTGTAGGEKARAYIIDQLKKSGIEAFVPGYTQSFSTTQSFGMVQKGDGVNVLAVIPGKRKETVVISAHYDHLGIYNNQIYNGADDNASGVVAILTIAQYFKKNVPEHRLIFAFFDAEERGLKGSAHFVEAINLKEENIVLNVNLDMVSRSDKNELYVCGTFLYPHLKVKLETLKTPEGITLLFGHDDPILKREDWTNQSDQFNFHRKKIPFIYFGVEDHPDYHRASDDVGKINASFYANSVETILQAVKALDKSL
jgi:Zn-dependent M28 family amino/carboxypeptidase